MRVRRDKIRNNRRWKERNGVRPRVAAVVADVYQITVVDVGMRGRTYHCLFVERGRDIHMPGPRKCAHRHDDGD